MSFPRSEVLEYFESTRYVYIWMRLGQWVVDVSSPNISLPQKLSHCRPFSSLHKTASLTTAMMIINIQAFCTPQHKTSYDGRLKSLYSAHSHLQDHSG